MWCKIENKSADFWHCVCLAFEVFGNFQSKLWTTKVNLCEKKIVTLYCITTTTKNEIIGLKFQWFAGEKLKEKRKKFDCGGFFKVNTIWIRRHFRFNFVTQNVRAFFFQLKFAVLMKKSVCSFPWISLFLCTVADKIIKMAAQCDSWNWQKRENDTQILAQLAWYIRTCSFRITLTLSRFPFIRSNLRRMAHTACRFRCNDMIHSCF